ncbi:hypothetical protein OPT61_g9597 [Boeremia exigua]|uniref:Uncharacterized protein n=1 Tax=Boeremia exigua TaxID=749465 RepID=A0ACC2HTD9_9PLEO|nr:hypothetical protein OPT61_g9597 [Boeremia exigua]
MNTVERGALAHEKEQREGDVEKGRDVCAEARDKNAADLPPLKGLSFLDRFLVLWILLAMGVGIAIGNTVDAAGPALQKGEFVGVSIPIGFRWPARYDVPHPVQSAVRDAASPALAQGALDPDRHLDLREGLIFVGVARCIAMVLIWTDLAKGDGDYCAVLVAFNSILQIVLFAPLAIFYVQIVSHGAETSVSYDKVAQSVGVFLGIPLGAAVLTRLVLRAIIGEERYQCRFLRYIGPLSLIGLLYTIIVLFASQGAHVVRQITDVLRVCAPLLVYFLVLFSATVWFCYNMGFEYKLSCVQGFTAASNNFELAIAVVVAVYGASSGQALASTVGPLIEVPVLVVLVYVLQWLRERWQWA